MEMLRGTVETRNGRLPTHTGIVQPDHVTRMSLTFLVQYEHGAGRAGHVGYGIPVDNLVVQGSL